MPRWRTVSDLPLLDAARQRLGDPEASRRQRRLEAAVAAERAYMDQVVDNLIQADDDGEGLATALRHKTCGMPWSTRPRCRAPTRTASRACSHTSLWTRLRS